MQQKKSKELIHCFPCSGSCSAIPGNVTTTWKNKHHHLKHSSLFLPNSIVHHIIKYGTSFWSLGVVAPGLSPPKFLSLPGKEVWETQKIWVLCKCCSTISKTSPILSTLLWSQIQSTTLYNLIQLKLKTNYLLKQFKVKQIFENFIYYKSIYIFLDWVLGNKKTPNPKPAAKGNKCLHI